MRAPLRAVVVALAWLAAERLPATHSQAGIPLLPGTVIDRSTRVRPGTYRLPSASLDRPAVIVRGDGTAVDMTGVTIEGAEPFADPDTYSGTGILIENAAGVTIRGAAIRGYKVGVLARQTPKVHLTALDVSYNWKPRLRSGYEQEHQADWLSFHQNEKDEWLRYGAAIYLSGADDGEVDRVRAVQGMNGLLVTRSARLRIWNNTFSYMSGLGIGLYRTTDSRLMHNRLDYCVRGYSHGFYFRGQDSAALLMYEQTSRNIVAWNSMTHGGDGVFLWAGQSTMDTGAGGANDNVFYGNDVSHAVANGIEATFSRNTFANNRIDDSWHGIWGGYSFDSIVSGNTFAGNDEAIAIEHGQNIRIVRNTFTGGGVGIRLWANATQDPNWGYPKFRDTRSRDYVIRGNTFKDVRNIIDVTRTTGVTESNEKTTVADDLVPAPERMASGMDALLPSGARRGRSTIIVDEWGPYDYGSPKIWPEGRLDERPLKFRVLGPPGRWRVVSIRGGTPGTASGTVPGTFSVTPGVPAVDLAIELEYTGAAGLTPRGEAIPAGSPVRVTYTRFDPAIDWTISFWKLAPEAGPVPARETFGSVIKTAPVRTESLTRLGFANARAFGEGFTTRIAVTAAGRVTLPSGRYELVVTSDDGIRVWVDDRLVLEDWTLHGPKDDRIAITGGTRTIRLEYFQNTGAAALMVRIERP